MKITSASLSNYKAGGECRVITARKNKGTLNLSRVRRMSVKELASYAKGTVHLTCEYLDLITGEVELPPVTDIKSINVLTKNKLADNVRSDVGYTFVRQESIEQMPQQQHSVMKPYTVFGVPDDFFPSIIPSKLQSKLTIATLDPFSMIAISRRVNDRDLVCHAYADEDRLILTFSIGEKLVYSRVTAVPSNVASQEERISFYYDTINLTYLYVRQSRQIPISVVILSGLLNAEYSLAESVETLTGVRVSEIDHTSIIKNCNEAQFHEYLLPIGAALVPSEANFTSTGYQEEMVYGQLMAFINIIFFIALLVGIAGSAFYFTKYTSAKNNLRNKISALNGKLITLEREVGDDVAKSSLFYIDNYLSLLIRRETTPAALLQPTQEVINRDQYTSLVYRDVPNSMLEVLKLESFKTYSASYMFETDYKAYLASLKERNVNVDSMSVLTIPERKYDMRTDLQNAERR